MGLLSSSAVNDLKDPCDTEILAQINGMEGFVLVTAQNKKMLQEQPPS